MAKDGLALLGFLVICFVAAAIGSSFTARSVTTWYANLQKPAGTPPSWIFGPVWTTLYVLMATAAWLVWRQHDRPDLGSAMLLFFLQLSLNAAWSLIFFGLRRPGTALIEIVLLLVAIVFTAIEFSTFSRLAFWLMTPYVAWVGFATFLNFRIWQLNVRAS
jgi:benzodiazapine receptor